MRIETAPRHAILAILVASLTVVGVVGVPGVFVGSAAAAAGNGPAVGIESPSDGSDEHSQPVIDGSASDDKSVSSVEITIKRSSDGYYYDGNEWKDSPTWLSVDGTTDWSYDVYDGGNGITTDGTYTVTARATDSDGQTQTEPFDRIDADPTQVTYTVDTQTPAVTSVTVTEHNGDDTVEAGDSVKVSATATDATDGVETVTVDASKLGGPASMTLSLASGDTYSGTFQVDAPNMGDGDATLSLTATDGFGQTASGSDSITLETDPADAASVTLHSNFVGVVEDDDNLKVTASGIVDAQGYEVDSDTATLSIAGQTYDATVTDGTVDTTIDTTEIGDDASTGDRDATLAGVTKSLTLVHEARSLDEGYQASGTPMPASDVLVEDVADVTTYDSDQASWDQPKETQAGEGYYINAESDDARIGYTFADKSERSSDSELLDQGYNLIGASPNMNDDESSQATTDLGADISPSENAIEVRLPTSQQPSDKKGLSAFEDPADPSDTTSAYEGYWVYVDSSGDYVRTTVEVGYEPDEQN